MISIAFAISESKVRRRISTMLAKAIPAIAHQISIQVPSPTDLDPERGAILNWLDRYFSNSSHSAILISDLFSHPTNLPDRPLVKEFQVRFGSRPLGTIGIMRSPRRVPDVDRTVPEDVAFEEFLQSFMLVIGRLEYIAPPPALRTVPQSAVTVRPLRKDNESEFRDYFRLRHRVYTHMGYLDKATEECRSKLEMNEADVHSIHIGAFYRKGPRETLVGSARVVINNGADSELQKMFETLAVGDPVARQHLWEAYPLGLPIFQSHRGMTSLMIDVYSNRQKCGELSRVIVDREFRGNGISKALVGTAIAKASDQGVRRFFLECLRLHEQLYEGLGFKSISGMEGPVVDVNRTMIAMELQTRFLRKILSPARRNQTVTPIRLTA